MKVRRYFEEGFVKGILRRKILWFYYFMLSLRRVEDIDENKIYVKGSCRFLG